MVRSVWQKNLKAHHIDKELPTSTICIVYVYREFEIKAIYSHFYDVLGDVLSIIVS